MSMSPEEKSQFQSLLQQVDDMAQMVQRHDIELASPMPIKEVQIPPHFHKTDKISIRDLKDGFTILDSTPTMAAEEGKCVLYTVGGSTVRVAFKVDQTWRTAALT